MSKASISFWDRLVDPHDNMRGWKIKRNLGQQFVAKQYGGKIL